MEPTPTAMDGKKRRVLVFWPLAEWLVGAGLVALGLWLGPWKHVVARFWLYPVIFGVLQLMGSQVLVLGRESLWLVYPFVLRWKRIRRQDILRVIDFHPRPGSPRWLGGRLCVRTADDVYALVTLGNLHKRQFAEILHDLYGVEITTDSLPPYHQEWH